MSSLKSTADKEATNKRRTSLRNL